MTSTVRPAAAFSRPVLRVVLTGFVALALAPPTAHAAKKFEYGPQFWPSTGNVGDEDQIPWVKVLTEMKDHLGRAKQVNYFVDVCYAGQAIAQSDPNDNGVNLGMAYTMSVATPKDRLMRFGWSEADLDPARRLKVGDLYYYSFNDYVTKRLKTNNPVPTVKQVFDAAKADVLADPDIPEGRIPEFVKRGGGDDGLKIKGDGTKSRAVVFGADLDDMYLDPQDESYRALNAYTFDSIIMYRHSKAQDRNRNPPIEGKGTWANFKAALAALKTQMADGAANTEVINLVHSGHGYRVAIDDGKPNPGPLAGPGPGRTLGGPTPPSAFLVPMDTDFWTALAAGLFPPPQDLPDLTRIQPARFFLAYSDHALSGSFTISIAGQSLGTFTLSGGTPSGVLTVPLSDAFVTNLVQQHQGAIELPIALGLAPGDWIQIGTVDDLLLDPSYTPSTYGAGLSTVVADVGLGDVGGNPGVPLLMPWAVAMTALLSAWVGGLAVRARAKDAVTRAGASSAPA